MCANRGIEYLNSEFDTYLNVPSSDVHDDSDVSVVGNLMHYFEQVGTAHWHKETVEYFLVFLFTEFAATPHNIRDGRSSIGILNALQIVVQDLVCSVS